MNFHYIVQTEAGATSQQGEYLKAACEKNGVAYNPVVADSFDFTNVAPLGAGDLLYRRSVAKTARACEQMLVGEGCATFYKEWNQVFTARSSSFYKHTHEGLPAIPSYPTLPENRELLMKAVDHLGGFPIILKVLGNSKGVGVIKIDSEEGLRSTVDYLAKDTSSRFMLRKFVPHQYYGRLIVVGDSVVASNRTFVPKGDFRSNTADNVDENREPYTFSEELQAMVVRSVESVGLEFAGVDLLFDDDGSVYIAEVNFPCEFEMAQTITGVDVADCMIKHLVAKTAMA